MRKKLIFILLAVLLLTPWPVAYAYNTGDSVAVQEAVRIEAAELSAAPSFNVFGRAIGGVSAPGDLFYVDAANSPADVSFILCLTNTQELVRCYRYMILKVGVYAQTDTNQWEKVSLSTTEPVSDTYVTLLNGQVSFSLRGGAKYKVTVDSGCFYCTAVDADGGSLSPQFYLTLAQA